MKKIYVIKTEDGYLYYYHLISRANLCGMGYDMETTNKQLAIKFSKKYLANAVAKHIGGVVEEYKENGK